MGWANGLCKDAQVGTFTVPSTAASYAFEKLRFGATADNAAWDSHQGCTVGVETSVASMVVELWLAKLSVARAGTRSFAEYLNDDFFYSGQALDAATGAETFVLAGWPCFEIRVKSGGSGGSAVLAATSL